jgi:hypothetical protein
MGLIQSLFATLFGGERNVVRDVAEVFRPNAEAGAQRAHDLDAATLRQYAAEFAHPRRGWFDRLVDALNRLPRPALAFGTLALFGAAMIDPIWFAERMAGLALVPEPLWWLMGAIVSFYFGARHQAKAQDFQASIAATVAAVPQVAANIRSIRALRHDSPGAATTTDAETTIAAVETGTTDNPALARILRRQNATE